MPQRNAINGTPLEGLQQDYTTSNLMIENNDLKKRIFNLEQEKIELQQNLSQSMMTQSGQNNLARMNSMQQAQQHMRQSDMQEMNMLQQANDQLMLRVDYLQKRERELIDK